jgi:hypothetical protein
MKVREDLTPGDYRDPGSYKHPQATIAREVNAAAAGIPQQQSGSGGPPGNVMQMPSMKMPMPGDGGHKHRH